VAVKQQITIIKQPAVRLLVLKAEQSFPANGIDCEEVGWASVRVATGLRACSIGRISRTGRQDACYMKFNTAGRDARRYLLLRVDNELAVHRVEIDLWAAFAETAPEICEA
jgi:hypothetical protein